MGDITLVYATAPHTPVTTQTATARVRLVTARDLARLATWTNAAAAATSPASSCSLPDLAAASSTRANACWPVGASLRTPPPASSCSAVAAVRDRRALERGKYRISEENRQRS